MTLGNVSLIGDIGGTNARFALVAEGNVQPEAIRGLPCGDFDNLDHAIAEYLKGVGVERVERACLAVASPVNGSRVQLTNSHWRFDIEEMRKTFGWRTFKVINDFTAMALGVLHVGQANLRHVCGGPGDPRRPILVMGPGTGLGVSGLVPIRDGWVPLMTEGGHVDFPPTNDLEFDVLRRLKATFGRVSVERLLCGEGLLNLYRARADILGVPAPLDSPEKITSAAKRDDVLARDTLNHFCEVLGRTAGNGVLTLGSVGGVYLCGGMLPRFLDFFLASPFRSGFEDKGRMRPLLESTPVHVVTDPYTGLRGAADALNNPEV
jgi:glucokinase